jgi:hypothetical protein
MQITGQFMDFLPGGQIMGKYPGEYQGMGGRSGFSRGKYSLIWGKIT